jgi:hypothetical protein
MIGADGLSWGSMNDVRASWAWPAAWLHQEGDVVGSFGLSEAKEMFFELPKAGLARIVEVNKISSTGAGRDAVAQLPYRSFEATVAYGQGSTPWTARMAGRSGTF